MIYGYIYMILTNLPSLNSCSLTEFTIKPSNGLIDSFVRSVDTLFLLCKVFKALVAYNMICLFKSRFAILVYCDTRKIPTDGTFPSDRISPLYLHIFVWTPSPGWFLFSMKTIAFIFLQNTEISRLLTKFLVIHIFFK